MCVCVCVCVSVCVSSAGAAGFDSVLPSGPDIAQFKQGVKTVAGKMAVLANGVMNTIQVRQDHLCDCVNLFGSEVLLGTDFDR